MGTWLFIKAFHWRCGMKCCPQSHINVWVWACSVVVRRVIVRSHHVPGAQHIALGFLQSCKLLINNPRFSYERVPFLHKAVSVQSAPHPSHLIPSWKQILKEEKKKKQQMKWGRKKSNAQGAWLSLTSPMWGTRQLTSSLPGDVMWINVHLTDAHTPQPLHADEQSRQEQAGSSGSC